MVQCVLVVVLCIGGLVGRGTCAKLLGVCCIVDGESSRD